MTSGATGRCPICRAPVEATAPSRPFCSPRCRLVDLGRWLREEYRVPGEEAPVPGAGREDDGRGDA